MEYMHTEEPLAVAAVKAIHTGDTEMLRGARATLKDAATLGLMDRVIAYVEAAPPPRPEQRTGVARDEEPFAVHSNGGDWLVAWHPPIAAPSGTPHGANAFCVTADDHVVLISNDDERWGWPGGRPEGDETWEQTMRREVLEEACAIVRDARLLGFCRAQCLTGPEVGLVLVRSIWRAEVDLKPWAPRFEIVHRQVVPAEDLLTHLWMDEGFEPIFRRALVEAQLINSHTVGDSDSAKDSPAFTVRRATESDAGAIASVLQQAFVEYEPQYTPDAFAATVPAVDRLRARWDEGPVWVALRNDEIVGTVAAIMKDDGVYVRSMAIAPDARGHGLGRQFLDRVERFAHERGAVRLFLRTTPFLHQAIGLYERYGFQRTTDGPQALFGTPLFTMEKRLTADARSRTGR